MSPRKRFDVFLSHNSRDKSAVRKLTDTLEKEGIRVWLDERELIPGRPWQEALEEIIQTANSAAVLVGKDGFGPWEDREMRACLSEFVDRKLPVIPVLLPGAPAKPSLPLFLRQFTWVDLRKGVSEAGLKRLIWGIKGKKPRSLITEASDVLGELAGVPELPKHFLPRPAELASLKERLLSSKGASVGLTGKAERVGVQGMGGIGKSVLAAAVAREEDVRKTFPDGVIWVALGQEPQLTLRQQDVLERAGGEKREFKDAEQGRGVLEEFFREKSCLLIVDDIWDPEHAKLFNVVGSKGKLLITS